MKNVSLLVSTIDSGGAEKQAVLLAVQLSKHMKINLIVLFGDHAEYKRNVELLSNSPVHVHRLSGNLVSKATQIRRILKETKTDVLLNYLTLPDVLGSFLANQLGIRVYNGIRNSRLPKKKMLMEKFAHNHWATGTIFNCYSGADFFGSIGFRKDKNIVIPNCFPAIAQTIQRADKGVKTIITVGRFDPQKDYETLIKSVSLLKRNDYRLCIVGYGVLEPHIRGWVEQYGLRDKTEIYIKPNNVHELERNADIYLSTSLFEGTSNSIMEALNYSLPVVATNVGDNDHLVIEGENGFLHSIGDAQGLSNSLGKLLDSVELRNQMGLRSNQNLRNNYSMEIFEERYTKLIERD
jgi:glycosyltransferase involved in cell wall biosynthesis